MWHDNIEYRWCIVYKNQQCFFFQLKDNDCGWFRPFSMVLEMIPMLKPDTHHNIYLGMHSTTLCIPLLGSYPKKTVTFFHFFPILGKAKNFLMLGFQTIRVVELWKQIKPWTDSGLMVMEQRCFGYVMYSCCKLIGWEEEYEQELFRFWFSWERVLRKRENK